MASVRWLPGYWAEGLLVSSAKQAERLSYHLDASQARASSGDFSTLVGRVPVRRRIFRAFTALNHDASSRLYTRQTASAVLGFSQ